MVEQQPWPVTHGVFFAVKPARRYAQRLDQLGERVCAEHDLCGRRVDVDRLHVTLWDLGEYPQPPHALIAAARQVGDAVEMRPFTAAFDRFLGFRQRSDDWPFVLGGCDGVAGLILLQRAIGARIDRAWFRRWAKPIRTPHMTVLYGRGQTLEQPVEALDWRVDELLLVLSLRGLTRHLPVGRWPLRG
jgi:RNA 2',3'-cyclic 3'-phosphodiesterase